METVQTSLPGVVVIEPKVFMDARGYFFESYSQREFDLKVRPIKFVQDNESRSSYGVLRGLHFQKGKDAQLFSLKALSMPSHSLLDKLIMLSGLFSSR